MKKLALVASVPLFLIVSFFAISVLSPSVAFADPVEGGSQTSKTAEGGSTNKPPVDVTNKVPSAISFQVPNPLGPNNNTLMGVLDNILNAIILLMTPVITIMLIYSGFLFVAARGNAEELTKAKQALMYTLIGAAIVLGAKGIALVIENTVTCLTSSTTGC